MLKVGSCNGGTSRIGSGPEGSSPKRPVPGVAGQPDRSRRSGTRRMSPFDGGCTAFHHAEHDERPSTRYSILSTQYSVRGTRYSVLSTRYSVVRRSRILVQNRPPDEAHGAHSPCVYETQRRRSKEHLRWWMFVESSVEVGVLLTSTNCHSGQWESRRRAGTMD